MILGAVLLGVRSETWYTADLHIGHRLMAEKRGFVDPGEHDAELARRWDAVVSESDVVWVLGDVSAGGRRSQRRAVAWIAERPGVKHLIAGNHDAVHPMHPDAHRIARDYLEAFASVQQTASRTLDGNRVLLSHFPYIDSDDPDDTHNRFDQWRLPFRGSWLLHGHTHSARKVGNYAIHVGLDAWNLDPVSINSVVELIRAQNT